MYTRKDVASAIEIAVEQIKEFNKCLTPPLKRDFANFFPHSSYDNIVAILSEINQPGEDITLKWKQLEAFEALAKDLQNQVNPETTALYLSERTWRVNQTTKAISDKVKESIGRYIKNNKIKNHVIVNTGNGTVGVLAHLDSNSHLRRNENFKRLSNLDACPGIARLSYAILRANSAVQSVRRIIQESKDPAVSQIVLERTKTLREEDKKLRAERERTIPPVTKSVEVPHPVEIRRESLEGERDRQVESPVSTNPFATSPTNPFAEPTREESPRVSEQDTQDYNPFAEPIREESPRVPEQEAQPYNPFANDSNLFAQNFIGSSTVVKKPTPPIPLKPLVKKKNVPLAKVSEPIVSPVFEEQTNPFAPPSYPPPPLPSEPEQRVEILRDTVEQDAREFTSDTNPFAVPTNVSSTTTDVIPPVETRVAPSKPVLPKRDRNEMNDDELNEDIIKYWQDLKRANPTTFEEKAQFLKDTQRSQLLKDGRSIHKRNKAKDPDSDPHNDDTITLIDFWYDNIINPKREEIIKEQDFQRQKELQAFELQRQKDLQAFEQKWTEKFNIDFFKDPIALNTVLRDLDNGIFPFRAEYKADKANLSKYITGKPEDAEKDQLTLDTMTKFELAQNPGGISLFHNSDEESLFEQFNLRVDMLKIKILHNAQDLAEAIKAHSVSYLKQAIDKLPTIDVPSDIDIINDINVSASKEQIKKITEMDTEAVIDQLMVQLGTEEREKNFTEDLEALQTIIAGVDFSQAENAEKGISLTKTLTDIEMFLDRIEMREKLEQKIEENKQKAYEYEEILAGIENVQAIYNEREQVLNKIMEGNKKVATRVASVHGTIVEMSKASQLQMDSANDPKVKNLLFEKEDLNRKKTAINNHIKFMQHEVLPRLTKLSTFVKYVQSNEEFKEKIEGSGINIASLANHKSILDQDQKIAEFKHWYEQEITKAQEALESCDVKIIKNMKRLANAEIRCLEEGTYDSVCDTIFRAAKQHIQTSHNYKYLFDHARSKGDSKAFQIVSYLSSIDNAKNLEELFTNLKSDPEDPNTHKKMRRVRGTFFRGPESRTDTRAKLLEQELIGYIKSFYGFDIENKAKLGEDRVQDILNELPSDGKKNKK